MLPTISAIFAIQLLAASFLGVLFLQSGLDKIFDYKGNLAWLTDYFSKTPLRNLVPLLLLLIIAVEMLAGLGSSIGAIRLLISGHTDFALLGAQYSALAVLLLFLGQRIAKDYAAAANMTGYFLISIAAMYVLGL